MGIGWGNGLVPTRGQAITWTNADPVLWRIYAALGGDESNDLTGRSLNKHLTHTTP